MKPISMQDIAATLAHCDTQQLATALLASGRASITNAIEALQTATDIAATFPRDDVIAEADALLFDVLRWPVADTVPEWEAAITADAYAAHQGINVEEARDCLARLQLTEQDAARDLLEAGNITNFTLEQAQVTDCITTLMEQGTTPTRSTVRSLALDHARAAMRPTEGDSPIIYSLEDGLAPRIMSPSPKVHAVLWLNRMEVTPPPVGILSDRIAYLRDATRALRSGARDHARVLSMRERRSSSFADTHSIHDAPAHRAMGMVS